MKQFPIKKGETKCEICHYLKFETGSDWEWYCPTLKGFICETHCCEMQMADYPEIRDVALKLKDVNFDCFLSCSDCPNKE